MRAEGGSLIDIVATGTLANPMLGGNVEVRDGTVVMTEPRIAAEAVNARIDLNQDRVTLSSLTANVNGGTVTGKGGLAIRGGSVEEWMSSCRRGIRVRRAARSCAACRTRHSHHRSRQRHRGRRQVTIQESGLTGDINFDTGLLATITARKQLELTPVRNPLLERVLFNVNVDTASPILVDNNLAKAEVTTDLRVVGTPYEPGLLGRLEVAEGGLVTLNERPTRSSAGR